mgnify:CR=1 FL=1
MEKKVDTNHITLEKKIDSNQEKINEILDILENSSKVQFGDMEDVDWDYAKYQVHIGDEEEIDWEEIIVDTGCPLSLAGEKKFKK